MIAGAIRATDTNFTFEGDVIFANNTADTTGGKPPPEGSIVLYVTVDRAWVYTDHLYSTRNIPRFLFLNPVFARIDSTNRVQSMPTYELGMCSVPA